MTVQSVNDLNQRSRDILQHIVDAYVDTGAPVGSRTLSQRLGMVLSPATIRNVMADLEDAGLLFSPHTSAGRIPTDRGLRLFVDGLLEIGGDLAKEERENIEVQCAASGRSVPEVLEEATSALAGLSQCAGLVVSPKFDNSLRHIEFVSLGPGRALVVMVSENGVVENRIIDLPPGLPMSSLVEASNYLNTRLIGRTLEESRGVIEQELAEHKTQLDELTSRVVQDGLAIWAGGSDNPGSLILRGQSKLLQDVTAIEDIERIRILFEALETKETMLKLIRSANGADGVQIFIGAENNLFDNTGCSMIIAPYHNGQQKVVGAIGVIGPSHMNYSRIIPMVDYTSKLIGKVLDGSSTI